MRVVSTGARAGSLALLLAAGLAAAGPATAAPTPFTSTSTLDAGYRVSYRTVPATLSASAGLVVPALTCTSASSGIGFWVATETDAPQDNFSTAHSAQSGVLEQCSAGTPAYQAWIEINGTFSTLPVAVQPADHVTMSVSTSGPTGAAAVTVTFADTTQSYSTRQTGTNIIFSCPRNVSCQAIAGATVLADAHGQPLPVASFGRAAFTGARLSGKTPKAAGAVQLNLVSTQGTPQVKTGGLNATGAGWNEIFKHS